MNSVIRFIYLTIFPEYFQSYFQISIAKRAIEKKLISYQVYNLRDFAKKKQVDDYPYGGGAGMLLKIEPIVNALKKIKEELSDVHVLLLSPQGKRFVQEDVARLLKLDKSLVFVCGHYEGIDARINNYVDEEVSIGDFITSGGELPSLTITEALIRAVPGIIKEESYRQESFSKDEYFDFDSYTRPRIFNGLSVPEILLSGNHKEIEKWRKKNIQKKAKKK